MRTRTWGRHGAAVLLGLGLLAGAAGPAGAVGSESPSTPAVQEDPVYREGVRAIKAGDHPRAIRLLETVVAKDPQHADAYNWLAYATRMNGDAQRAIPLYEKALALDPKHRGAHEYIGEAYLVLGDLTKAKAHLAILDKLCFLPCSEYSDLKKAVQAYEASGGQTRPASKRVP